MAKLGGITVDGQEYALDELTLDELEELEQAIGKPLGEISLQSAGELKQVVYHLLRRAMPELTLRQVGAMQIGRLVPEEEVDDTGAPLDPPPPASSDASATPTADSAAEPSGARS